MPMNTRLSDEERRRRFVKNRRIPPKSQRDGVARAVRSVTVDPNEKGRRGLFELRRRALIVERHPLDGDNDLVLDGLQLLAKLEAFLASSTTQPPRNTEAYDDRFNIVVGASHFGGDDEEIILDGFELTRLAKDTVVISLEGVRLRFKRVTPKGSRNGPVQWVLELKSGGGNSGRSASSRSMGHGPDRSL